VGGSRWKGYVLERVRATLSSMYFDEWFLAILMRPLGLPPRIVDQRHREISDSPRARLFLARDKEDYG
jgi:hypothetical protein